MFPSDFISVYPTTAFNDYSPSYSLCGIIPTTIAGKPTSLTYEDCVFSETGFVPSIKKNAPSFTFPSHPALSDGVQPGLNTAQDPRGLTYQGVHSHECDDSDFISPLFPGLGLWSCEALDQCGTFGLNASRHLPGVAKPNIALQGALYLTATSTSTEGDEPTSGSAAQPTANQQPSASPTVSLPAQTPANVPPPSLPSPSPPDSPNSSPSSPPTPSANPPANMPSPLDSNPSPLSPAPPGNSVAAGAQPTPARYPAEAHDQNGSPPLALVPGSASAPAPAPAPASAAGGQGSNPVGSSGGTSGSNPGGNSVGGSAGGQGSDGGAAGGNSRGTQSGSTGGSSGSSGNGGNSGGSGSLGGPAGGQGSSGGTQNGGSGGSPGGNFGGSQSGNTGGPSGGSIGDFIAGSLGGSANSNAGGYTGGLSGGTSGSVQGPAPAAAPIVYVPVSTTSTNAQGSAAVSTNFVAATPVLITSTNPGGNVVISTSHSIIAAPASPTPVALIPTVVASTNPQGSVATSTSFNAAFANLVTSTNAQGQAIVSTNTYIAPISASVPTVITSVDANGNVVSNTAQLPALVLTTTNAQGSQVITTSPLPLASALIPSSPNPAITPAPALTIGNQVVTANSLNQYLISDQTLTPGGVIVVSGTPISLSPDRSALAVGNSVENLALTPPPALTIGSQTITANSQNQYIINGQTLTPGGLVTVSGTPISLSPDESALAIGTSIENLAPTPAPVLTIGSQIITANSQNQYVVSGQTLTAGGLITISGTPISLSPDKTALLVGTSVENLVPTTPAPTLTIGTQTITPNSLNQYIVNGQTLTPGGTITLSGTRISLSPDKTTLIVGTSTGNLVPSITIPPALTIGSQTVTANSQNQYLIAGQTLTPGGTITLSGTRISLSPDKTALIIGTSTENLSPTITKPPTLTIGSQTITANSQNQYLIAGQTLTPGGVITVSGTRISLTPDETAVIVGTSTEALTTSSVGTGTGTGSNKGPTAFAPGSTSTGRSAGTRVQGQFWLEALIGLLGLGIVMLI